MTKNTNRTSTDKSLLTYTAVGGILIVLVFMAVMAFVMTQGSEEIPTGLDAIEGDVALFTQDCVETVLNDLTPPEACNTAETIEEEYGVDVFYALDVHQGRMISTVRMIADGQLLTEEDFEDCMRRDECVDIPMIPPDIRGKKGVAGTPQAQQVRETFWHLVNNGRITPETCSFTDICRAMYKLGIIRFE